MNAHPGTRDLYAVLEVPRAASAADLKKAYYHLAKKYHPDHNPGDKDAEDKFKEASNAYAILSDDEQRARYDRYGFDGLRRGGPPGAEPFEGFKSVEDIFSAFGDLFGDFFSRRASQPPRGADLHLELHLAFHEAVWGTHRDVKFTRTESCAACSGAGASRGSKAEPCRSCQGKGQVVHTQGFFMVQTTCSRCQGRGRLISAPCTSCRGLGLKPEAASLALTIPPGVDDGQTLRVGGRGECTPGGAAGDLYVVLRVTDDDRFAREGADVTSEVPISFARAALGGEVEVDTLDDGCRGTAVLELSPGTQPDDLVARRGQGVPHLNNHGRGDHLVRFKVEVPRRLSDKQAKALREFAAEMGEELGEKSRRTRKKRSR